MTYTQQLRELLNELKLAKGKNCLIFAISERPARLKELIESNGFDVWELYLEGKENLLEMLLTWNETTENTIYVVHGIGNQFPWVLPYINLHRDMFFDIKRPVVVLGSEYEITEIQKHAPDWFRFRSRTYELKEEELGEKGVIMSLAEPAESKTLYYPLPVFVEEGEEEIKERIKIDEYLLSSERDDYKLAELYMSLSLSYFKLSRFKHGENYLHESMEIREKLKDNRGILLNYIRLSALFIGIGYFEKGIEACNEAIELNPNIAQAYYNRGTAYGKLKEHEEAIEDYNKALELNPEYAAAYNNRGTAYGELKQYEEAIEDYNKAIELNPNIAQGYNNRGNAYGKLKQYEEAIEDYNKAIELNPNIAQGYNNRGNAYGELKQYEKAIEDYNKALELNPEYAAAYYNRGTAYGKLKQHEKAIEDYNKALELNPNIAQAYYNRGNAYGKLKQHEKAIKDYGKAIASNHDYGEAYSNRGYTYAEIRKYEEAARDLKEAGILFVNLGRQEDAFKVFSLCFELRTKIESGNITYSGLALLLITKKAEIGDELRGMRIQDETLRKIFSLTLMKLRDEDISGGIAMLEEKEQTEEKKILFELLKTL
jgi:tetratricopeptide (TPR) repeat protein